MRKKQARVIIRYTATGKFLTWEGQTVSLNGGTDADLSAIAANLSAILGIV